MDPEQIDQVVEVEEVEEAVIDDVAEEQPEAIETEEQPAPQYMTRDELTQELDKHTEALSRGLQSMADKMTNNMMKQLQASLPQQDGPTDPVQDFMSSYCKQHGVDINQLPQDVTDYSKYGSYQDFHKKFTGTVNRMKQTVQPQGLQDEGQESKEPQKVVSAPQGKKANVPLPPNPTKKATGALTRESLLDQMASGELTVQQATDKAKQLGFRW